MTRSAGGTGRPADKGDATGWGVLVALGCAFLLFTGLGVWQVHRRAWKLDLIARVESRIHRAPVMVPGPDAWSTVGANSDEYRHVFVDGRFEEGRDTLVRAVTEQGPGYWLLTPLRTGRGFVVLVNRGYIPPELRDPTHRHIAPVNGPIRVTGLLRLSEPRGAFLRANDPARDAWFSRDVGAIAARHHLTDVAPYFIDADAGTEPGQWPLSGLTRVQFPNNHLVYALTWFGLALMAVVGGWIVLRGRSDA